MMARLKSIFKPDRQKQEEREAKRKKKEKIRKQGKGTWGRGGVRSRIAHRRYAKLMKKMGVKQ